MIQERVNALREKMKEYGVDMYLIPTDDFHSSEYVGDYFKCRRFMSGFTGSAGTMVVTQDMAGLWTDGRYFLQAESQLAGTGVDLYKIGEPGVPSVDEFVIDTVKEGQCLGFDGRVVSYKGALNYREKLAKKHARIEFEHDLVDLVWEDRPALSASPAHELDIRYAGKSRADKLSDVRAAMAERKADYLILTSLDDIAWLLNIRGGDVAYNPVVLSYAVVMQDRVLLFANESVFDQECRDALAADQVVILPYNQIYTWMKHIGADRTVWLDGSRTNYAIVANIPDCVKIVDEVSPTRLAKAIKNEVEIRNIRKAHVKDGVAETRFMYWLKQRVQAAKAAGSSLITDEEGVPLTEIRVSDRLEAFRAEQENFMGLSFDTIAGFGPHGAIIHYSATPETDVELHTDDFLLVDSGAQYLEGTTDITRTFVLGEVDEEHKKHFTMVLRGHLNLGAARFKYGTCGANLDYLTREPLWRENMDYNHGTGHGVGYFLNVHEGPNSIHWQISPMRTSNTRLEAGMLTSNEPGLYLEGRYGIRHENLVLCCEGEKNAYGQFLHFDTVTLVPFDLDGVEPADLNETERRELNEYHAMVYDKISPYLNGEERDWLAYATRAI